MLPTLLMLQERARAWDAAQVLWRVWSCSLGPAPESSPDRAQQSLNLGTFPELLSCLARGFCWCLSGNSKFGRNQYHFCWGRWESKAAPLLWLPQTILMQHHVKQLCKRMCHSWKAK